MLYLIGTVHRDPLGFDKLKKLLRQIRPEIVLPEISPLSLSRRRDKGAALKRKLSKIIDDIALGASQKSLEIKRHPAIESIYLLLNIPFEYRAALSYAKESGSCLIMPDDPEAAREKLELWETELITRSNIESLLNCEAPRPLSRQVAALYKDASLILDMARESFLRHPAGEANTDCAVVPAATLRQDAKVNFVLLKQVEKNLNPGRERLMAARIRRLAVKYQKLNIAYIGGWEHLLTATNRPFLASLLTDLKPERFLLNGEIRLIDSFENRI